MSGPAHDCLREPIELGEALGLARELAPGAEREYELQGGRPTEAFFCLIKEVIDEAMRQDSKYGWQSKLDLLDRSQSLPMVCQLEGLEIESRSRQERHCHAFLDLHIEELSEVAIENDPEKREAELIQLATLALTEAQALRERRGSP